MKFLADVGISMSTAWALRQEGHDTVHLRDEGLQQLPDEQIVEKARMEARTILTFDLDFGDLLASGVTDSPSVIIFRLHNETPSSVNSKLMGVLKQREADLERGAVVVVEDTRYRLRSLPIGEAGEKS
jgi:predicted nuclease of predicted toxin-antitoxin system